ncbi:MAG: hypothetical protein ACE5EL_04400, partial [Anaerolineae bacterium]
VRVRPAASDALRSRRITDDRQDGQASPWPDEEHGRRAAADAVELTRLAEAAPGSRIGRH